MVSASEYPRNELGMTYGPQHLPGSSPVGGTQIDPETYGPDLVLTFGDDGTLGYTMRADLNEPAPSSPEEAARESRSLGVSPCTPPLASQPSALSPSADLRRWPRSSTAARPNCRSALPAQYAVRAERALQNTPLRPDSCLRSGTGYSGLFR